ncbi:MAG TPA: carboxypeptidase-like regulatory domain-containing protein [Puia sp.]
MIRFYAYSKKTFIIAILAFCCTEGVAQQVTIRGTVFNMYKTRPLDGVSVICSCGKGTTTDSNGNYMIRIDMSDSLRFSYLGRATQMFAVNLMNSTTGFDIALHVNPTELAEVRVAPKNYYLDSLQNRKDYEKIFDYRKPGISLSDGSSGSGVGLDLDELINMFRFKRNRRLLAFQERLIEDEQDKFIDHRFTHYIVKKITGLSGNVLDSFMFRFRPSFQFTKVASDYEFYDYIKLAYQEYENQARYYRQPAKKEEHH